MTKLLIGIILACLSSSCTLGLSPETIEALAKDSASFCLTSDIRGGVGSLVPPAIPSGGYGQGTLSFCRSNYPNSSASISPDGSISIQHGN